MDNIITYILRASVVLTLLLGFTSFFVFSQESDNIPISLRILPPSMDNYIFTKNGNIQFNGNSGGFSYSVPLYDINYGPLSCNISLDYYTSGIKVNDVAGKAGMGWNLNAGGMITRVVKGSPDEKKVMTTFRPERENLIYSLSGNYPLPEYLQIHNQVLIDVWDSAGTSNNYDNEQDWFTFYFNGISGSFFIHEDQIYLNTSTIGLKASFKKLNTSNSLYDLEFTFKTPNGFKYVFGGSDNYTERSEIITNCYQSYERPYPTTWYLKSISNDGWSIDFHYEQHSESYPLSFYEQISLSTVPETMNILAEENRCVNRFLASNSKYLKSINFGESFINLDRKSVV